jgi:hypothetical protein
VVGVFLISQRPPVTGVCHVMGGFMAEAFALGLLRFPTAALIPDL